MPYYNRNAVFNNLFNVYFKSLNEASRYGFEDMPDPPRTKMNVNEPDEPIDLPMPEGEGEGEMPPEQMGEAPPEQEYDPSGETPPEGMEGQDPSQDGEYGGEEGMDEEAMNEDDFAAINNYYDLKKIYARLISISRQLSTFSTPSSITLNKDILESIDLFHILISNYDKYSANMPNIIKQYARFLERVTQRYAILLTRHKRY